MTQYVDGLPPGATPEDLRRAFSAYGQVLAVGMPAQMMRAGRARGPNRGYGFVRMRNARAALAALDGRELLGKRISVRISRTAR